MELLAAAGLATGIGKELFNYNRENFKFDQDQRLERESLRLEMQVKRFELFREDVRDLVELTVDRMDVYHLVGALFLEFCIVLFCEGRVQASAPTFLLSLFLLSNACSFIYLLLAVWLSMHASIASHSFGVRLLTRFVRLPIPSIKQMNALTMNLKDYEKQGVANLLKIPFIDEEKNAWYTDKDEPAQAKNRGLNPEQNAKSDPLPSISSSSSKPDKYTLPFDRDELNGNVTPPVQPRPLERSASAPASTEPTRPTAEVLGRSSSSPGVQKKKHNLASGDDLLPEDSEHPVIGGDDILYGRRGLGPERHVQLFRQLQSKWQCYDAYCRVSMGLGVNLILQALSYFSICHTLVENRSPSTGYAMTLLFQSTTIALAVLDLAGLKRREIFAIQLVGILPCLFTAIGVSRATRNEHGVLDPEQLYALSPFAFFSQLLWLELWIRVAAPSSDKAKLPRRFRQVLFLDVFGDAVGWDPTVAEDEEAAQDTLDKPVMDVYGTIDDADAEAEAEAVQAAAREASSQLSLAQWAIRRWMACPESILSAKQGHTLSQLKLKLGNWGATIRGELDRLREKGCGAAEFPCIYEPQLRQLHEMDEHERAIDPFAGCLVGPMQHDGGAQMLDFHYDVEERRYLWQDDPSKICPGALLLTLDAVATTLNDLERDARRLLEMRIMADLKAETRRQKAAHRAAQSIGLPSIQESLPQATSMLNSVREANREGNPVKALLPNVLGLFSRGGSVTDDQERVELISRRSSLGSPQSSSATPLPSPDLSSAAPLDLASASSSRSDIPRQTSTGSLGVSRDPTLVAMAGQHARHFVPERLPWQVLKGMTRVLQLCWGYAGFMALLKELKVYEVDFQLHVAGERRLLGRTSRRSFERVDTEWPHGSFFRPQSIFCDAGVESTLLIGSPFALYSTQFASPQQPQQLSLYEIDRSRLPPASVLLCSQEVKQSSALRFDASSCIFAGLAADGLSLWPAASSYSSANKMTLPLEGSPWRQLAGGVLPCSRLERLQPPTASRCLLLIGWDGEMFPVAILPLPNGSMFPAADTVVKPGFDAPLFVGTSSRHAQKELDVVSISFEVQSGHLWAISSHGELELWDLMRMQFLGKHKLSLAGVGRFRPAALCESAENKQILVVGRSDTKGPLLFSMQLENEFSNEQSFMAT